MLALNGPLHLHSLRPRTGRGVRIVVIDSGVYSSHPHVGGVAGGVSVDVEGGIGVDFVDRLGHGTAVTAVIREKAPGADVWAARVFERRLDAPITALVSAIDWALTRQPHLINLSLGTAKPEHRPALEAAVGRAIAAGAWIVAAGEENGVRWLPGTLDDVVSVRLDWSLSRDTCVIEAGAEGTRGLRVRASGFPRPVPGVSPERNLKGLSFAVANATGLLALAIEPLSP
ncbi:MAG: S8 family serine peptidase [Acidobacteria bacterium]|nr:S8 family serine peptidase [Acidobacteriota bacterium]